MKNAVTFIAIFLALGAATGSKPADVPAVAETKGPQFTVPAGLKTGDLVFRKGKGLISTMFGMTSAAPEQFSHVGMVAVEKEGIFVYHMIGNTVPAKGGCKRETLESFCNPNQNSRISFYRLTILEKCQHSIKEQLQAVYASGIQFDEKFELSDRGPLYCSELIYNLVKKSSHIALPLSYHRHAPYVALDNLYNNSFAIKLTDINYSKTK